MHFFEFLTVPAVLFVLVVAPLWIVLHYRSVSRSSRGLSRDDRLSIDRMLETVDRLTDRIETLEAILDERQPEWRGHASGGSSEGWEEKHHAKET